MTRLIQRRSGSRPKRALTRPKSIQDGFTLVELLMVIAIITVLMSLLVVSVFGLLGNAKVNATKGTIRKIQTALQQRVEAFNRLDFRGKENNYLGFANGDKALAQVLAQKAEFRNAFPMTWAEARTAGLIDQGTFDSIDAEFEQAIQNGGSRDSESAEVLYFVLTEGKVLGYTPVGTDVFSTSEFKDVGGSSRPEFIDAWEQPLRFYRWPTRLLRPNGYTSGATIATADLANARILNPTLSTDSSQLIRDPEDPLSLANGDSTYGSGWTVTPANFESQGWHTVSTYHAPLVVSAGPDNLLGLLEPHDNDSDNNRFGRLAQPDSTSIADLYDNITNFTIKSGGN